MGMVTIMTGDKQCKQRPKARGAGRPPVRSREETLRLIARAATEEFMANGYARTSIKAVVARAGVSTKSLYKIVPNKAELFRLAMDQAIDISIQQFDDLPSCDGRGRDGLRTLVMAYTRISLSEPSLKVTNMIWVEHKEFPELLESYRESGRRFTEAFDQRVARLCRSGAVTCSEPLVLADFIRNAIDGMRRQVLFGQRKHPNDAELRAWVDQCTRLFVEGASSL